MPCKISLNPTSSNIKEDKKVSSVSIARIIRIFSKTAYQYIASIPAAQLELFDNVTNFFESMDIFVGFQLAM